MTHVISDDCISCGACESTCPTQAISQGDTKYIIDPAKCTDCASCVESCPVSAISKKS
jgi:ferredoxin